VADFCARDDFGFAGALSGVCEETEALVPNIAKAMRIANFFIFRPSLTVVAGQQINSCRLRLARG
jgi:hypothetical protein